MKQRHITNACFAISIMLFLLPEYGYGMIKHFGQVAHPETGVAVKDAKVFVCLAGTEKRVTIFGDAQGKSPFDNPATADPGGRYSFYAPNGKYRLRIVSPKGKLLYDHDDVSIYDPRDPQRIVADEGRPALSLHTMGVDGDVNLPLVLERRNETGELVGARWRYQTHCTEVTWQMFYNARRRAGIPDVRDLRGIDLASEPSLSWGNNDADDGIFGLPGMEITGGGLWHGGAHNVGMDLRLSSPRGGDSAGIVVLMDAPNGLAEGDVVALDRNLGSRVKPVTIRGEKLPFVVAKVDKQRTFVMARGLAWVKVHGPVEPGDILVTSSKPRHAERHNGNSDPGCSLGVAVSEAVKGKALTRIARIGALALK